MSASDMESIDVEDAKELFKKLGNGSPRITCVRARKAARLLARARTPRRRYPAALSARRLSTFKKALGELLGKELPQEVRRVNLRHALLRARALKKSHPALPFPFSQARTHLAQILDTIATITDADNSGDITEVRRVCRRRRAVAPRSSILSAEAAPWRALTLLSHSALSQPAARVPDIWPPFYRARQRQLAV
jgi:hypothetical protein